MTDKKRTILLLPPTVFPIPAVGGGAVEQLITHLLDVNESENRAKFIVVSKYDAQAAETSYRNSLVLYLDPDGFVMGYRKRFRFLWGMYRVWLKLFRNRVTEKLLPHRYNPMDLYAFQCALLAKWNRADFVVNELHDFGRDWPLDIFNHIVGRDKFYNHIHSSRQEYLPSRKIMNNSISISHYVRSLWAVDPTIPGRNEVLYNCIDVERFGAPLSPQARTAGRATLGVGEKDFLVIFTGRLLPVKGVRELLEAFDLLYSRGLAHIKLLLIGSAAFSQGSTTEFSQEMAERAKNSPNIIPLGYIPNSLLPEYYTLADAQVVPSTCQEGAGLVAIEGMAAGLPLIVTKSGGMPEYTGEQAALQLPIDPQLPQAIAEAIGRLAQDPALCAAMGQEGKKQAEKFRREAYYAGFLEIVERAFQQSPEKDKP